MYEMKITGEYIPTSTRVGLECIFSLFNKSHENYNRVGTIFDWNDRMGYGKLLDDRNSSENYDR